MTSHASDSRPSRRTVLTRSAAVMGAASSGQLPSIVQAQTGKVRASFMPPYTGTFTQLGVAIENGFRMAIAGVTSLMHKLPDSAGFGQKVQDAELDYLAKSQAASTALAENYVGLLL